MVASGTCLASEDDDDPPLRPGWDETEDETDIDLRRPQARLAGMQDQSDPADAWRALLACSAQPPTRSPGSTLALKRPPPPSERA
jgi:hypothetical protein